ncbi:3,4-dihydroxy 2-butanone 4-phosphate synthase/GTP cyclohydrolase II [Bathymodiolus japonicus methanotrophic gill symbiont]|uniref:bifunctional 3,4-dihydroxy-2-butanone-4-phosphate synthase/GTP cyclohydrolase II n=1 Tax=Bathymodiolus japonicus methanotrophic gill symbiont TaxID=113269 RepID=UPI001B4B5730|nr:bifunctional 3,4-dihydroxy-2-butanone-4-phosphate synthase/GTP cyclohydrolase II [Bathymodiolus japonicus methanotrophic gill symbiont]GFO71080.1 3,4-dihydroxy 2-butanone 4-phosphate synthase/GTP cyclohydrolase II [Bathymodiolus japonicus methanotrophic gill symbiont]
MNTTEEIIADIHQGKMVIIMDDEDRENEGDLVMAAEHVRPEDINFMARFGRGLICLTLTGERCQQLRLPLMVNDNNAAFSTNFTVSIEAADGVTTGISAADRAKTIQDAVAKDARPDDIVQPGHVFPIRARDGGVLNRAGHTEAACDLARLAGAEPAGVIVEILNDNGSMARRPDLEVFAKKHHLKIGTIADLIHYRTENESTLERISECDFPTDYGDFRLVAFQDRNDNKVHLAVVMGDVSTDEPVLVRVHARNLLDDIFSSTRSDCQMPVREAMKLIAGEGRGVLVIIRQNENNKDLAELVHQYQMQDNGVVIPAVAEKTDAWRTTGTGSQILADLGVHKIKVIGPHKTYFGLSGFNLELVDSEPD